MISVGQIVEKEDLKIDFFLVISLAFSAAWSLRI